jgi:hypothetical protein
MAVQHLLDLDRGDVLSAGDGGRSWTAPPNGEDIVTYEPIVSQELSEDFVITDGGC